MPEDITLGQTGRRVLVVEDEPWVLTLFVRQLARLGYDTMSASRVDEAFALLHETPFDLLLADITLSKGEGGLALAEWVRSTRPGTPVLLTSGSPPSTLDPKTPPDPLPLLRKPYKRQDLEHALAETLARAA